MGIISFFKNLGKEKEVISGEKTKDKFFSSENSFASAEEAKAKFELSKKKLFDVNNWSKLPEPTSTFELYNHQGQKITSPKPEVGNFIRIDLPGPTPENWVKVTDLKETENSAEFTVSPSEDPREKDGEIEHFFIKEATSTFKVELKDNTIYGYEIGKNEGINNEGYEAGDRELINTLIAEGGWAGFQDYQWHKVTDFYVHKKEIQEE